MLWTHTGTVVTAFSGSSVADLPVPCTADFNVVAGRYFHGLEAGEVPLSLLFNGTVFYRNKEGALQAVPIPWDKEADFRLPVSVWKEMMAQYFPGCGWLCVRTELLDRLARYKSRRGAATWEQALESLLQASGEMPESGPDPEVPYRLSSKPRQPEVAR